MSRVIFKRCSARNFLSVGNAIMEYELDSSSHTLLVGSNGFGKCCHSTTLIDININDPEIMEKFNKYLSQKYELQNKNNGRKGELCIEQN